MKHWHWKVATKALGREISHSHNNGHIWHEHWKEGLHGYGKTRSSLRMSK